MSGLGSLDRAVLKATQAGLPLTPRPWHDVAAALGEPADAVMACMNDLLARGIVRRIGAVPNHYAVGFRANAMSVWDVPDDQVDRIGAAVGALEAVSHCYRRPRHPPVWPYNLFAMLHGRDQAEVEDKARTIADQIGARDGSWTLLFSTRILKKTGPRLTG